MIIVHYALLGLLCRMGFAYLVVIANHVVPLVIVPLAIVENSWSASSAYRVLVVRIKPSA